MPCFDLSARFAVGARVLNLSDATRINRAIPVDVYYPATETGSNQPVAGAEGEAFPVVVFGHGFTIGVDNYRYLADYLVARGFIVALVDTEGGFLPNHTNFGRDLAFVTDALQAAGADSNSPFFARIAAKTAVMGHSMGGGASFLAVQYSANISAMVTLAAANTNPSSIEAAANIALPSLVIAGGKDTVAPPNTNQTPMYNALLSDCKYFVSTVEGSHCNFAPDSFTCSFGEGTTCFNCDFMDGNLQRAITVETTALWLAYTLQDCDDARTALDAYLGEAVTAGNVTTTSACGP